MKILLIIFCVIVGIYLIYKLCMLKYEILFRKGIYKSGDEPVYFNGNREVDDDICIDTIRNGAILTKGSKNFTSLTYSKYNILSNYSKHIISYRVYKILDKTDVEFKNYILKSSKCIEDTLSSLIIPIKINNTQEYLYYINLFKDIKTFNDIENYHNTLVKELIDRYNKLISNSLQCDYLDNNNKTIKRILNICKNR